MPTDVLNVLLVEDTPSDPHRSNAHPGIYDTIRFERAATLSAALQRLDRGGIDAVLLDLVLPGSRDMMTIRRIQDRFSDLPIIVLSGFEVGDLDLARQAVRNGAQDFLFKNCTDPELLDRALRIAIERKCIEQHRLRWSHHDEVTGLPNMRLLGDRFERAVVRSKRQRRPLALLAIEIDHVLNTAQSGSLYMDERLMAAAGERLRSFARRGDTLARMRTKSFALLIENLDREQSAAVVADKLLGLFREPFHVGGKHVALRASIGIAGKFGDTPNIAAMIEAAEFAMFEATAQGGNCYRNSDCPALRAVVRSA